jgi:hypothetical protein
MPLNKPTRGELSWDIKLNAALDYLDAKVLPGVTVVAVPATPTSTGSVGQIAVNTTHLHICVATNTWVRVARAAW